MLHSNFGLNRALNDVKRSHKKFGGKAILLVVSKKEKSSYLKNRSFFGLKFKVDLICHIISVST